MNNPSLTAAFKIHLNDWNSTWNKFWFSTRGPQLIGLIRLMVGLLIFYTHFVWLLFSADFLVSDGLLPTNYRELIFDSTLTWSHLDWFGGQLVVVHAASLVILFLFAIGLFTRVTSVLACLVVISYANRATGALFGLDQISVMLTLYLAIGNCGGAFSVDQWLKKRKGRGEAENGLSESVLNNISIRLIQLHMCIVYLFAGIGKLQGETWLNGEAIWGAMASHEYQTMDFTWLSEHMWLVNIITLVALAWEVAYPFLIWPRLTRPIMLLLAVGVHLGIGLAMGMMEFGLIMIMGNMAFIPHEWFSFWNQNQTTTS